MRNYLTYLSVCFFAIFSFLYMNRIVELSKSNNIILDNLIEYKNEFDYKCYEGYINEFGIVLGINGKSVNVSKSYSNMKGIGFKEELIEYEIESCVTSKDNNMDKYILSGNPSKNSISIVIDVYSGKYYEQMAGIFDNAKLEANILIDNNNLESNMEYFINYKNLLFKGNNDKDFKNFGQNINELNIKNVYCVKTNDYDVIDICKKNNVNSVLMRDEIEKNLLYNIKHSLNKGDIIFIRENEFNLNELSASIKYIKSRGINIVSVDELVF